MIHNTAISLMTSSIRHKFLQIFSRRDRRLKFVQFRKGRNPRDQRREIFHFGQMPEKSMTLDAHYYSVMTLLNLF